MTATAWQHNRRTHRPQASDVLGLRLNVWTSIIVFLCAATYFAVSARLRPGRERVVLASVNKTVTGSAANRPKEDLVRVETKSMNADVMPEGGVGGQDRAKGP